MIRTTDVRGTEIVVGSKVGRFEGKEAHTARWREYVVASIGDGENEGFVMFEGGKAWRNPKAWVVVP